MLRTGWGKPCEVRNERYGAAQPERSAADDSRRAAAQRGRNYGASARDGHEYGYQHVGSGAGIDDIRRCAGESSADAKAAADLAGRRRVKVGTAGVGHKRGTTGEHAR